MFSRVVHFLSRHRLPVSAALLLLAGLSVFSIVSRPISSNILDLLPLKDRVIGRQYRILSEFRAVDRIVIDLAKGDSTRPFSQLSAASTDVMAAIEKSGLFDMQSNASPEHFLFLRNVLVRKWAHLFTVEDSAWLSSRMQRDTLANRFTARLSAMYTLGASTVDPFLLKNDPFGFADRSLARLQAFKPTEDLHIEDGLITDSSRSRVLLLAATRISGLDDTRAQSVTAFLDSLQNTLADRGIELTWMGAVRASRDNTRTIKRDVHLTAPVSFVLILLICMAVYRRWYFGLFAFLPTALGILYTLGLFASLGGLSLIILGFGAALLGITIDYAIHYICHCDNTVDKQNPVDSLAPAILAGALTTAGAFAVLVVAGIPGLAHLGMITAVGIIVVALLSLSVLPAVFTPSSAETKKQPLITPSRWFESFYASRVSRYLAGVVFVVTVIMGTLLPRLTFDGNPDSLNGMSAQTRRAEKSIEKNWTGLSNGTYLATEAKEFDRLLTQTAAQVEPLVKSLRTRGLINPATPITGVIPPYEIQRENLIRWNSFWDAAAVARVSNVIDSVRAIFGVSGNGFKSYMSQIDTCAYDPVTWETFSPELRSTLLANYIRQSDSGMFYGVTPIFPTQSSAWRSIAELSQKHSVLAVNDAILGLRVVEIIKSGFVRSVIYIPLVVACMLLLVFRNFRATVVALLCATCAAVFTLGTMAALHVPVTIVTLMIFAFIFGLGIDYTVLMVHMGRKSLAAGKDMFPEAAASVTIAAATTLAGLGTLALAKHPVLAMVGKTGIIGIVSSYVCAIVLVPVLVGKRRRVK